MREFEKLPDAMQLLQDIRDGTFEGATALAKLAATKQFLFHGSPDQLDQLEPRQAISDGHPHGEPAVSAAPDEAYELAIFMALIKSGKNQINRPHGSRSSGFSIEGARDGRWDFHADRIAFEDATSPEAEGYVYVFTKRDFVQFAQHEWRTNRPVKPIISIRVTAKDFPADVKIDEDKQ